MLLHRLLALDAQLGDPGVILLELLLHRLKGYLLAKGSEMLVEGFRARLIFPGGGVDPGVVVRDYPVELIHGIEARVERDLLILGGAHEKLYLPALGSEAFRRRLLHLVEHLLTLGCLTALAVHRLHRLAHAPCGKTDGANSQSDTSQTGKRHLPSAGRCRSTPRGVGESLRLDGGLARSCHTIDKTHRHTGQPASGHHGLEMHERLRENADIGGNAQKSRPIRQHRLQVAEDAVDHIPEGREFVFQRLRRALPRLAHRLEGSVHRPRAVGHRGHVGGEGVGKLTVKRYQRPQCFGTSEQLAIYLLLEHAARRRICLHTLVEVAQERLEPSRGLDGCGVKLDSHLGRHLRCLRARLNQGVEYRRQLRRYLRSVAAHARQRREARHQLVDAHSERGRVGRHPRQGRAELPEVGHTVLCRQLYLVLDRSGLLPARSIVLDDGRGDAHHLTEVGHAADTRPRRRLQEADPVVLRHTVAYHLIQAVG